MNKHRSDDRKPRSALNGAQSMTSTFFSNKGASPRPLKFGRPLKLVKPAVSAQSSGCTSQTERTDGASTADSHYFATEDTGGECDDDGVELVMSMLDSECGEKLDSKEACNMDHLMSTWRECNWVKETAGSRFAFGLNELTPSSGSGKSSCRGKESASRSSVDAYGVPRNTCTWTFSEDCVVADIFTSVCPTRQRIELGRRLPGRRWSDARERFRIICSQNKDGVRGTVNCKSRWRNNAKAKPDCIIRKMFAKLRK